MKGREPLPLPWAPTGKMRYRIVDAGVVRQTADKMVTEGGLEEARGAPGNQVWVRGPGMVEWVSPTLGRLTQR
jgi:hypothetical protein